MYTNANILNEAFSEEELSALQANIPEDYYKDFFLQNNNTNDPDGDVSNQVISAVTLDSKYPLLKVKDDCIYGNKYNYTIYLYDELGKVSEPITVVL